MMEQSPQEVLNGLNCSLKVLDNHVQEVSDKINQVIVRQQSNPIEPLIEEALNFKRSIRTAKFEMLAYFPYLTIFVVLVVIALIEFGLFFFPKHVCYLSGGSWLNLQFYTNAGSLPEGWHQTTSCFYTVYTTPK